MKKGYRDLEMETVTFEAEDVITASGAGCDEDGCKCLGGVLICTCNNAVGCPQNELCDCVAPAYACKLV